MKLANFEGWVTELLSERSAELEENFPEAAARILKECLPRGGFEPAELVRELISRPSLIRQRDVTADFGDPPVTLLEVGDAFCDVYFWHKSPTSIHSHTFEGAFAVGHGSSIHSTYSFLGHSQYEQVRVGQLVHQRTELLEVGDTRLILPGEQLYHRVSHLGCPSVSFVIRRGQFGPASHFIAPSLELPYFRTLSQAVRRKYLVLTMALETNQCSLGECLRLARETLRPEEVIHFLNTQFSHIDSNGLDLALSESGLSDAAWADALRKAHAWQRAAGGYQSASSDAATRLVWSLGSSLGNRQSSREALQKYFQVEAVGVKTVDVLLEMIEEKLLPMELNESAQVLLEVLIDEGSEDGLVNELVHAQGEDKRAQLASDLERSTRQMREHAFLSAFVR